jgi:alpha-1,6-mannosyltransferase
VTGAARAVRRWGHLLAGLGVAITLALTVTATRHAEITEHSPIRPEGGWSHLYTRAAIAAFALYVVGLLALRRTRPLAPVLALAAAVQLAPLAAPLLLSTDAYAYWDYGRIGVIHDGNPYADRPSEYPDDPAYERMGADWREKTSVYGPAFTAASETGAQLAGDSPPAAARFFRLLAAAAALALVALTAVASRGRAFAAAFVGWNPLLALHFAGGGHNDVLMMALVGAGLALAAAGRRRLAGVAWAVAVAVKLIPLVLLPLQILADRRRGRPTQVLGFAVGVVAVSIPAFLLYGPHWLRVLSPVANQLRQTSSLGLPYLLAQLGVPQRVARDGLVLLFAVLYLWLLREAWRGRARLALAAVALLIATSWLQPWYAVWAVPLAAVEEDRLARVLTLALSAYFLRDALPL